jgi:hypothetical protein
LVIGGAGDSALRRAARYADGWHAIHRDPAAIQSSRGRLNELSGGQDLEIQLRINAELNGSGSRWAGASIEGNPDAVRAAADAYERAGVDVLILDFHAQPLDEYLGQIQAFAAELGVAATAIPAQAISTQSSRFQEL